MRILLVPVFVLLTLVSVAQQQELYHRVKINTGKTGLSQLAKAGIAVDHGSYKKNTWFITDLSVSELEKVKETGLTYTILIEDVSKYYRERNQKKSAEKPTGGIGCVECSTFPTPLNFELGAVNGFFSYQQMLNILDSMRARYPSLITIKQPLTAATTLQGRPMYYVKISDNADQAEAEPEVLYTALHHAREPESLSQLIFYMWYLLENYNSNAEIKYLVDHTEMYFVPCVNPDGYVYNLTANPNGGGMWRKNRRNNGGSFGVDLNRNYGKFWGYDNEGSSPNGNSDTYRGPSAFSEPETQMIRDFCNNHSFRIALNAHTYSNLLIYPYGYVPSLQTPDSLAFQYFAHEMAACSGFLTGTGDLTVGYVTNGDSDDWMYDEQTTKGKILSLTPEAGDEDDGFWPMTQRIIPIAKQTMDQNLAAARLSVAYAHVLATDEPVITTMSSQVHFDFNRTGLENGTFTVSLIPLSANIGPVGSAKVFTNPQHLVPEHDSIALELNNTVQNNTLVRYIIRWENNTGYHKDDTISRIYGNAELAFYSNGNSLDSFISQDGWDVTTTQSVSAPGSITDSPDGNYPANAYTTITTRGDIDLTGAASAYLTYDARWDIERGFDYVTIAASQNGGNFSPLCGMYTRKGNEVQDNATAVYDGLQDTWVKELIDLGDYAGQKIRLRFTLTSDGGVEKDGFYFDEFAVHRILSAPATGIGDRIVADYGLQSLPNPCYGNTAVYYRLPADSRDAVLLITDNLGRVLLQRKLDKGSVHTMVNVSGWAGGMYFYRIADSNGHYSGVKKMVVRK